MSIKAMHHDLKSKLNKVDSNQNRNLRVEEIDWALNEAQELFVKIIAEPRYKNHLGFETNQRSIDDIRTIVKPDIVQTTTNNLTALPNDYWHFLKGFATISKTGCNGTYKARLIIRQHDDRHENSSFDISSFKWREVSGEFVQGGIKTYADDFTVDSLCLTYLEKLPFIHNAEDSKNSGYNNPITGVALTGTQDSPLPEHTHREIVDIAVLILSGQMSTPQYQAHLNKLGMLNISNN